MGIIYETTSARELQKGYRKIFNRVRETGEPVYVMSKNKLDVIIVSAEYLTNMKDQVQQEMLDTKEAVKVYNKEKRSNTLHKLTKPSDLLE
jgi:PHD/YefM family antitoxin component YafN of YafNO toxin-antitoxin module